MYVRYSSQTLGVSYDFMTSGQPMSAGIDLMLNEDSFINVGVLFAYRLK